MDDPSYAEEDVSDKPAHISKRVWTETEEQHIIELNSARIGALQAVDEGVRDMVHALLAVASSRTPSSSSPRTTATCSVSIASRQDPPLRALAGGPAGHARPRNSGRRGHAGHRTSIDIAPTIVAAAQATAVRPMDGRNLLPVMKSRTDSWETLLIQAGPRGRAEMDYGWFYRGVRDERWTYVYYLPTGEEGALRPAKRPLAAREPGTDPTYAGVLTELRSQLEQLQACAGGSCRITSSRHRRREIGRSAIGSSAITMRDGALSRMSEAADAARLEGVDVSRTPEPS
jgi:hypothetical protein